MAGLCPPGVARRPAGTGHLQYRPPDRPVFLPPSARSEVSVPPAVALQYLLPKRAINVFAGWCAHSRATWWTHNVIPWFIKRYGVNMDDTQIALIIIANVEAAATHEYGEEFKIALQTIRRRYNYSHVHDTASIAVIRPRWFCDSGPSSDNRARTAHCTDVTCGKRSAKIARWRWVTRRST